MSWRGLIERPGRGGPWGALIDETARAADGFLRVVETFDDAAFAAERPSDDPDCRSPRAIAEHAEYASWGYVIVIRKSSGQPPVERPPGVMRAAGGDPRFRRPPDVRPAIRDVLILTEQSLGPLEGLTYEQIRAMETQVRWGPRYDPEMMLEHGICHFLRHRRQLERWRAGS